VGALGGALGVDDISAATTSATAASLSDPNVGTNKTVTVSGVVSGVVTGSSDPVGMGLPIYGYQFSASGNVGTVTPAQASVSITGTRPYDGTNIVNANIFALSGLANNETLTLIGSGTVADKNVGSNKPVSLGSLTLGDGTGLASNYTFTGGNHVASITPAILGVAGGTRPYDGTNIISSGLLSLSGLVSGETLSLSGNGLMADKSVGSNKTVSIASVSLLNGTGLASNYSLSGVATTATITGKSVTPISITAQNKIYDGSVFAAVVGGQVSGLVPGDDLTLFGSGIFADKNVGIGKTVTTSQLVLGGGDAGNYVLAPYSALTASADITARLLDVTGLTAVNRDYNGGVDATAVTSGAVLSGLLPNDVVTISSVLGSFSDKNVGAGKTVVFSEFGLSGTDGRNYKVGNSNSAKADITTRPLSSWIGSGSGLWSDPRNWDAIPDGNNVLAVNVPAGRGAVIVDASAGAINLQSLNSGSGFVITGGSLQVANNFTSNSYVQSGGSVSGAGAFNVNGSFNQTAGNLSFGTVSVAQNSGDLNISNINAPTVLLTATSGAIRETGALVATGKVTAVASGGIFLNSPNNRLASFQASATGPGNIELTNVGVLDVAGIRTTAGSILVNNTGGISTSGPVVARGGRVVGVANSPLTIGPDGVSADGDIVLTATNLTSAGNITLNGPIESTSGGVALSAASNLTQNSSILAPLGVSASAGGTMTFGPLATSGYQPVSYAVNNQPVTPPRPPASNNVATDLVVSLMQTAPDLGADPVVNPIDSLLKQDKERDLSKEPIVSEGQICRP
jgi:hypothetical protein